MICISYNTSSSYDLVLENNMKCYRYNKKYINNSIKTEYDRVFL